MIPLGFGEVQYLANIMQTPDCQPSDAAEHLLQCHEETLEALAASLQARADHLPLEHEYGCGADDVRRLARVELLTQAHELSARADYVRVWRKSGLMIRKQIAAASAAIADSKIAQANAATAAEVEKLEKERELANAEPAPGVEELVTEEIHGVLVRGTPEQLAAIREGAHDKGVSHG